MQIKKFNYVLLKNDKEIHNQDYTNESVEENKIEFNCLAYNTTFDLETKTFTRENEDFLFFLDSIKKSCTIHLKKENLEFPITVDDCNLEIEKNKIILEYIIETDDEKCKMILIRKD